jgi:mediator of RNA polymerase II transcription subunit 13
MSPSWTREHEDWESNPPEESDAGKSEESESEEADVDDSPMVSRPSTPPPAYLPMGPTLLHTQFRHSELLPLSTPLRPPGVAVAHATIASTAAAASVPTPVSPAAALGAASEKSKSLEAAAYTVAKEVVENCVWAEAWRSTATGSMVSRPVTEVLQIDVETVVKLLEDIPALQGPLDIKELFELGTFQLYPLSNGADCLCDQNPTLQLLSRRLETFWSSWNPLCSQ